MPVVGSEIIPERRKQKHCIGKGHIYLGKFQERFLRLADTDFQTMALGKGTRQTAARQEHRQRSVKYQCPGEDSPIWPSVVKRMCRSKMGDSEVFWDYFLDELG